MKSNNGEALKEHGNADYTRATEQKTLRQSFKSVGHMQSPPSPTQNLEKDHCALKHCTSFGQMPDNQTSSMPILLMSSVDAIDGKRWLMLKQYFP